jgi:hypothetical protein
MSRIVESKELRLGRRFMRSFAVTVAFAGALGAAGEAWPMVRCLTIRARPLSKRLLIQGVPLTTLVRKPPQRVS